MSLQNIPIQEFFLLLLHILSTNNRGLFSIVYIYSWFYVWIANLILWGQLFSYATLGFATTGLTGAGIGVVFGALIIGVSRNPSLKGQLFSYAILGFAFAEATGLFALMMAFLLLYVA